MWNKDETKSGHELQFGLIRPGDIPKTPILWPVNRSNEVKIQQTKGSAKPLSTSTLPTTQPNQSPVPARTTPRTVSKVRVILRPAVNGQKTVTVQFTHPAGDQYFSGANVYLKRSGQQPTQVAGGAKSPLTFTVPVNEAPHSVYITSVGNWGETDILTSPSHPVRLT